MSRSSERDSETVILVIDLDGGSLIEIAFGQFIQNRLQFPIGSAIPVGSGDVPCSTIAQVEEWHVKDP